MIALTKDPRDRRPFLITVSNFDDSPSAQRRDLLPFLVNRFRFRVNKNGEIGLPFQFLKIPKLLWDPKLAQNPKNPSPAVISLSVSLVKASNSENSVPPAVLFPYCFLIENPNFVFRLRR